MKKMIAYATVMLLFLSGCSKSPLIGRIWDGELYRKSDGVKLSDVCLKMTSDSLYIYSNAIFGKSNENLYNADFEKGAFVYTNSARDEFRLKPEYDGNSISLQGDNFYIDVQPFDGDWEEAISFYRKKEVPRNADSYFFGVYVGKTRGRIPAAALMGALFGVGAEFMDMEITVTLEFLEGNRCRMSMKAIPTDSRMLVIAALGGASLKDLTEVKVLSYKAEKNRLVCGNDSYYIQSDGTLLMPAQNTSEITTDKLVLQRQ